MLSNIKKSINPPNVSKRDIWGLDSSPLTIELSKEKKNVIVHFKVNHTIYIK